MGVQLKKIAFVTVFLLLPGIAAAATADLQGEAGRHVSFLFDNLWWVIFMVAFCGLLLAAVVPWSWPLLRSMFNGWVPRDFAKSHHPLWYEQLNQSEKKKS